MLFSETARTHSLTWSAVRSLQGSVPFSPPTFFIPSIPGPRRPNIYRSMRGSSLLSRARALIPFQIRTTLMLTAESESRFLLWWESPDVLLFVWSNHRSVPYPGQAPTTRFFTWHHTSVDLRGTITITLALSLRVSHEYSFVTLYGSIPQAFVWIDLSQHATFHFPRLGFLLVHRTGASFERCHFFFPPPVFFSTVVLLVTAVVE